MKRHPGFTYVFQSNERAAQSHEEHQDGNHAQRDRGWVAALRRFAGLPAFIAISASVAAGRRLFPSAASANIDDDQLGILRSHCPGHDFLPSLLVFPACSCAL